MRSLINLLAPEVRADPYILYRRLRDEHPVCEMVPGGIFAVSRYDDVMYVLRHPQLFSSSGYMTFMLPPWLDENPMVRSVLARDPPEHTVLRTRLGRALSARLTPALENRIRAIAAELCARLATLADADFIAEFAAPLPARLFAELCGLDPGRHACYKRWADDLSAISPAITRPERMAAICASVKEAYSYLRQAVAERRHAPGDDLISDLLAADAQGHVLDEQDVLGLLFLLLPAGFDTTTYLLAACVRVLAERPEELRRLRDNPGDLGDFIQEVLRYDSPVHGVLRKATQEVVLQGVRIPAGAVVCALLASANRDERKFATPDSFDPAQQRAKEMAFGHGIHYCLGASLAQLEVRIALQTLLARFCKGELLPPKLRWNSSLIIRGPVAQPMRWTETGTSVRSIVPATPPRLIRLQAEARDIPLSQLTDLLAVELAEQFGEHVRVVRGQSQAELAALADGDVVLLEGLSPTVPAALPETVVSLHRGAATPSHDPRRLPTLFVDGVSGSEPFAALAVAQLGAARLPHRLHFDTDSRDAIARWARAITGRQVGLALSGGGTWGFTHVALLRKLQQRQVPIDLIAGSSMGSVVGAYYCAKGLAGLELLLARARRGELNRAAFRAIVSTAAVQHLLEEDLGAVSLSALRTRFHAVLTEVDSGEDQAALEGPLALAVCGSSSAPGIFGPTVIGDRRYIDGSMSNHVPADVVRGLGAGLVLASNCYPSGRRTQRPKRTAVQRLWDAVNPMARLTDLVASGSLLLHRSGRRGGAAADVLYEIAPQENPLAWAADYRRADAVLAMAERDVQLEHAAAALAARWQLLRASRSNLMPTAVHSKEAA